MLGLFSFDVVCKQVLSFLFFIVISMLWVILCFPGGLCRRAKICYSLYPDTCVNDVKIKICVYRGGELLSRITLRG